MEAQWYWCLTHERTEAAEHRDDPDNALGPYPTEDAARNWKARNEARNEAWEEADEAWAGDRDDRGDRGDDDDRGDRGDRGDDDRDGDGRPPA